MRRILLTASLVILPGASIAVEVGYWSFNEGAGTAIHDSSGFGHLGLLVNGSNAWTTGRFGTALTFDGTVGTASTRVQIDDSALLRLSTAGSFAAWVFNEDIGRDAPILAKEGSGQLSYWFGTFGPSGAGHWGNLFSSDGGSWQFNGRDRGNAPGGEWTHLASSWDGSTIRYYVNGVEEGTLGWSGPIAQTSARLFIGTNSEFTFQGNATAFKGKIDEVHIYNHAISAADVRSLAAVPEPAALSVLGLGSLLMVSRRKRRRA